MAVIKQGSTTINSGAKGDKGEQGADGARGNLRDSQTFLNPIEDYLNQYNWSTIFEIIL